MKYTCWLGAGPAQPCTLKLTLRLGGAETREILETRAATLMKGWAVENECVGCIRIKLADAEFGREYCITEHV